MNDTAESIAPQSRLVDGRVVINRRVCREHYRLTVNYPHTCVALPGQFLHLAPANANSVAMHVSSERRVMGTSSSPVPLLRRAFSIAGLRPTSSGCTDLDIIYRVVGTSTRWLSSLRQDDVISILGPLGNAFPINTSKTRAILVAGGVGLPPMLWLAGALNSAGRQTVAIVGAHSADLLALTLTTTDDIARDGHTAGLWAQEFSADNTPVIICTDDGSIGFRGYVGGALSELSGEDDFDAGDVVVYTCGPEVMMRAIAEQCIARNIECYVCMERSMACGTGTCQSCVVPVHDDDATDGWRYELCCAQGPVFAARRVIWSA